MGSVPVRFEEGLLQFNIERSSEAINEHGPLAEDWITSCPVGRPMRPA